MACVYESAENIWVMAGSEVRVFGVPCATRTTIVRLQSGGLWLHSPILPDEAHFKAIEPLGHVEHLIAPNKLHSFGIRGWKARYPNAKIWLSPKFADRHPDIIGDAVLCDPMLAEWKNDIDFHVFAGSTFLDEVLFLHKASRKLLVADLIQKHDPSTQSWFWSAAKQAAGVLGRRGGTGRDLRATFLNRTEARKSRDHVMNWRFENLILCHGQCVLGGGKSAVSRAFSWLGPSVRSG